MPRSRAVWTVSESSGTVFMVAIASSIGTGHHVRRMVGDDVAELALFHHAHGRRAEAQRQQAVAVRRAAAALQVAEHQRPDLEAGRLAQVGADLLGEAAQPDLAAQLLADGADVAVLGARALGDDDDAVAAARGVALLDALDDAVDVVRDLGEQDDVGVARDAGVHRDPARVAAHHLDDHDALVRLGGGVQAIDRLGGDGDRGVEAERRLRARQVVVDGLRDADDRHALLRGTGVAIRNAPSPPIAISASPPTSLEPAHDVVGDVDRRPSCRRAR